MSERTLRRKFRITITLAVEASSEAQVARAIKTVRRPGDAPHLDLLDVGDGGWFEMRTGRVVRVEEGSR